MKHTPSNNLLQDAENWTQCPINKEMIWDERWHKIFKNDKFSASGKTNMEVLTIKDHSSGETKTFFIQTNSPIPIHKNIKKTYPKPKLNDISKWINNLPLATQHPYATAKKISLQNTGVKIHNNSLVIPMTSIENNQTISCQFIPPKKDDKGKWPKKFKTGPQGQGTFFTIGHETPEIFICEGLATAISIHKITNKMTIIAFSRGKLDTITKFTQKNYPHAKIILALDNDQDKTHKTTTTAHTCTPNKKGDFNDYQEHPAEIRKLQAISNSTPLFTPNDNIMIELKSKLKALHIKTRFNSRTVRIQQLGLKSNKWEDITDFTHPEIHCMTDALNYNKQPNISNKKMEQFALLHGAKALEKYLQTKKLSTKPYTNQDFKRAWKALAIQTTADPFKEWLLSLKWDKKPRLENFLFTLYNINTEYKEIAKWGLKSILLGAVWRTHHPGTKHDEVLILRSIQGLCKSSLLETILPHSDFFTPSPNFKNVKELGISLAGKVIAEIADLSGFKGKRTETLKAFISSTKDDARLNYDNYTTGMKRMTILVGTCNDYNPLPNDLTGTRRFAIIDLNQKIPTDTEFLSIVKKHREQLWAEAQYLYTQSQSARPPQSLWKPISEINEENRMKDYAFEEIFEQKTIDQAFINTGLILKEMKDGNTDSATDPLSNQTFTTKKDGGWIKDISINYQNYAIELLKKWGWNNKIDGKKIRKRIDGKQYKVWLNPKFQHEYNENGEVVSNKPTKTPPIPF